MLDDYDISILLIVKSYEFNPIRTDPINNVTDRSVYYYLQFSKGSILKILNKEFKSIN